MRYAIYIFDCRAPTGLRLALKHPERVTAIISQNGNAYIEGLSKRLPAISGIFWDGGRFSYCLLPIPLSGKNLIE